MWTISFDFNSVIIMSCDGIIPSLAVIILNMNTKASAVAMNSTYPGASTCPLRERPLSTRRAQPIARRHHHRLPVHSPWLRQCISLRAKLLDLCLRRGISVDIRTWWMWNALRWSAWHRDILIPDKHCAFCLSNSIFYRSPWLLELPPQLTDSPADGSHPSHICRNQHATLLLFVVLGRAGSQPGSPCLLQIVGMPWPLPWRSMLAKQSMGAFGTVPACACTQRALCIS